MKQHILKTFRCRTCKHEAVVMKGINKCAEIILWAKQIAAKKVRTNLIPNEQIWYRFMILYNFLLLRHWMWCNTSIDCGEAIAEASPRSILILSRRYYIISNASIVNNCFIISLDFSINSLVTVTKSCTKPLQSRHRVTIYQTDSPWLM